MGRKDLPVFSPPGAGGATAWEQGRSATTASQLLDLGDVTPQLYVDDNASEASIQDVPPAFASPPAPPPQPHSLHPRGKPGQEKHPADAWWITKNAKPVAPLKKQVSPGHLAVHMMPHFDARSAFEH